MITITTSAKTLDQIKALNDLITVELKGSEKQIKYAYDILSGAINGVVNSHIAPVGRGKEIVISIDDKIIQALNMNDEASKIIGSSSKYQWESNSIKVLVSVEVK